MKITNGIRIEGTKRAGKRIRYHVFDQGTFYRGNFSFEGIERTYIIRGREYFVSFCPYLFFYSFIVRDTGTHMYVADTYAYIQPACFTIVVYVEREKMKIVQPTYRKEAPNGSLWEESGRLAFSYRWSRHLSSRAPNRGWPIVRNPPEAQIKER